MLCTKLKFTDIRPKCLWIFTNYTVLQPWRYTLHNHCCENFKSNILYQLHKNINLHFAMTMFGVLFPLLLRQMVILHIHSNKNYEVQLTKE